MMKKYPGVNFVMNPEFLTQKNANRDFLNPARTIIGTSSQALGTRMIKLYKTIHLKELTLKCKNFDIVEEILYKLKKDHEDLTVLEIPYSFKQRLFGHTKRNLFLFILTYIGTIIRLRFDF